MSTPKDSWSSSSSTQTWKYDVFLNFRGEDTRNGFVSHLYAALKQKSISTFKDDVRLERGKHISSDLLEAIETSRFAIVIFSKNYAFSRWCLDELVKIVECKKNLRTTILPVFYHVDPSDVRNQRKNFARAFVEHKNKNLNKEQMWKDALKEVADISGWHLQNRSEAEIIQKIVEMILHKLNNTFSIDTKGLIGIESQVDKLIRLLAIGLDDVRFIGIQGMGGMGKTTLARVVYSILSNKFEACCFIGNIREVSKKCGLLQLQQSLLYELLMERCMNIQDVDNGVLVIKNRLRHKRILLVLDDITEIDQLNKLAGEHDWFGQGSRVVITTRDKHLLLTHKVRKIYEPTELNYNDALQLFSLKVFGEHHPTMGYLTLSKSFVQYANGVPLAIEVLGSFLFKRSMEEWKSALGRLKEYPESKIIDVLQISFDGLDQTEKEIFLHIACFFNQYDKDLVEEILDCLDLYPKIGLARLIDKSLVKLHGNKLWMHDLLQQMGRNIIRQECHKEPWKRNRMWLYKDIDNALAKNMVLDTVEGIVLNWPEPKESHWNSKGTVLEVPKPKEAHWNCEAFSKMPNLKLLVIHNVYFLHDPKHLSNGLKFLDWSGYSSKYLPSNFLPDELVGLRMCCNNIEQFWTGTKCFDKLKFIQLNDSRNLIETPDFTKVPNLEKLVMEDCLKLHTVHSSMGVHRKLTLVNFKGCKSIRNLPRKFEMESLEILILSSCSNVQKLPKFMGNMERVSQLYLDGTAITKLLTSIGHLSGLALLNIRDCKSLVCLPSTVFNLKLLKNLDLSGCSKLERLPENLGNAESIMDLNLSGTAIRQVSSSIRLLKNLRVLCFSGCEGFSSSKPWYGPSLLDFCCLTKLNLRDCNLEEIPNDIGCLFSLWDLNLSGNSFGCLPKSITQLSFLRSMCVENCTSLQSLPKLPLNIGYINGYGCTSLETVPDLLEPNSSIERRLYLSNCSNLANNQGFIDMFLAGIGKLFQVPLSAFHSLSVFFPSLRSKHHALCTAQFRGGNMVPYMCHMYDIVAPGSEIPEWFSHRSMDNSVKINEPSHLYNELMGIAVCVVFCSPPQKKLKDNSLSCWLTANGKEMSSAPSICEIDVLSDHIWLLYLLPDFYHHEEIKSLSESDANGFNQISIYFGGLGVVVKKCGLRMVYKRDIEELNRTMAQSSKNNNTTYDLHYTLDNLKVVVKESNEGLHGGFSNLTVVVESNKVRQTHDDCDEAGPIEERSSNDVPNPKRIERITELIDQCEELSTWTVLSQSF